MQGRGLLEELWVCSDQKRGESSRNNLEYRWWLEGGKHRLQSFSFTLIHLGARGCL